MSTGKIITGPGEYVRRDEAVVTIRHVPEETDGLVWEGNDGLLRDGKGRALYVSEALDIVAKAPARPAAAKKRQRYVVRQHDIPNVEGWRVCDRDAPVAQHMSRRIARLLAKALNEEGGE